MTLNCVQFWIRLGLDEPFIILEPHVYLMFVHVGKNTMRMDLFAFLINWSSYRD